MKIKSLLAGISTLALTAGSAHALVLEVANVNGTMNDAQEAVVALANETVNTGIDAVFEFQIRVSAGAAFPAGDNVDIIIDLPSGVTFGTGGVTAGDVYNGTNGSITGASLTSGGAEGSDVVRLLVSIDPQTMQPRETIGFQIPLEIADAGCDGKSTDTVDITVEARTEAGTRIDGGVASGAIIQCTDALVGEVLSDEATDDSFVALVNDYNNFGDAGAPAGGATSTVLGTVEYMVDNTAIATVGANSAANTNFVVSDVDELTFDVVFENATGIDDVVIDGISGVQSGNVFSFTIPDTSGVFAGPQDITVFADADATTFIATQEVVVRNAVLTYDNMNLATETEVGNPGDVFCGHGDLDFLQREGREFGFFDWVAEMGAVNNLFRVTGLSTTEDTPYSLTFDNSRTGQDGTFSGVIAAADVVEGEYVFSSRNQFSMLNPGYGRADVNMIFETNNDLDVDRLISSNGVVASYGDSANSDVDRTGPRTPATDSDQTNGSE